MIGPTVVLSIICFVAALLLSFTYNITTPVIEANKKSAVNEVSFTGMPTTTSFTQLDPAGLPDGIAEAFMTADRSYYIFMAVTKGWGGPVTFYVGLDADGHYAGIKMGENSETPGLGSKVAAPDYLDKFYGHSDPGSVDAVTGVTITTNALKAALALCSEAFDILNQ